MPRRNQLSVYRVTIQFDKSNRDFFDPLGERLGGPYWDCEDRVIYVLAEGPGDVGARIPVASKIERVGIAAPLTDEESDVGHEFKPGDRVRDAYGRLCTILATDGDLVWVDIDGRRGRAVFHRRSLSPAATLQPSPAAMRAAKEIVSLAEAHDNPYMGSPDIYARIIDEKMQPAMKVVEAADDARNTWRACPRNQTEFTRSMLRLGDALDLARLDGEESDG